MTVEERELAMAFKRRQDARGLRSLRKVPYYLAIFFDWLEAQGLARGTLKAGGAEDFQSYLTTLEKDGLVHYASKTVADIVETVDQFYRWMLESSLVGGNPFDELPRVKVERSLPLWIPTQEETAGLLDGVRQFWKGQTQTRKKKTLYRLHVIAELMYSTGMRMDELAKLEARDVDWSGNTVLIREGKGGAARIAYLNEYAREVLRIYIEEMREVLGRRKDNPTIFGCSSGKSLDSWLNGNLKKNLGMTSHNFRHMVGTHLLQAGCDLRYIQLILGHESLESTALYTKVTKEDLRDQLDKYHPRR